MADQQTPNGGGSSSAPINQSNSNDSVISELKQANAALTQQLNNMKSEFTRKMSNIETRIPQPQQPKDEPLEDMIYTNPKKVIETITETVNQSVNQKLSAKEQKAQVIGDLMYDYPELQDKNSEFFKATVKAYEGLSPDELANDSLAYKLAVKTAAIDMGLPPRHKRQSSDDFSMDGGNGGGRSRSSRHREEGLSDSSLSFAQLVGLDVSDPKVVERLKSRAQRKNWNRYE